MVTKIQEWGNGQGSSTSSPSIQWGQDIFSRVGSVGAIPFESGSFNLSRESCGGGRQQARRT
jgi:hypothetical protein